MVIDLSEVTKAKSFAQVFFLQKSTELKYIRSLIL